MRLPSIKRCLPPPVGALIALAGGASVLLGCATLPDDGQTATFTRLDNLRSQRYCELLLVGGDALAHDLRAAIYNTTDLNEGACLQDSCPARLWDQVDVEALQRHYAVQVVHKNGPYHWLMDWMELPLGTDRDFNGLQARWMGELLWPKGIDGHEKGMAYRPTKVALHSAIGFAKGQPVFFLESPDGTPWVMLSYANTQDPKLSYEGLQDLGARLKPPPGWTYRVKVLDKYLTIRSVEGHARVLQDELDNRYAACFEMACSYSS